MKIQSSDTLLGTGSEQMRLVYNSFPRFIKAISVAIRASRHPSSDDRFATFTNFEVRWRIDDFLSTSSPVRQVIRRHIKNNSGISHGGQLSMLVG